MTAHYNTNFKPLESFADFKDSRSQAIQADLSKEEEVVKLFEKAAYTFGPVQVLIVNHAISVVKREFLWEMSLDRWKKTMDANLTSSFLVTREYLKRLQQVSTDMKEDAAIVLIGSTAGKYGEYGKCIDIPICNSRLLTGEAGHADYAASKSGTSLTNWKFVEI